MSIHFPPRHFTVPAGLLARAILRHERYSDPAAVSLAPCGDVIILDRRDWRDETPPQHGKGV